MEKYLNNEGLLYFWQKIKNKFATKSDLPTATSQLTNDSNFVVDSSYQHIDVDGGLDASSSNPVQNSSITAALNDKVDKVSGKGLSTNDYTSTEKSKLSGIATGAEVNVQADWNVTDTSSDAYIKNKPNIPSGVVVDSTMSDSSVNPVQNKIVKKYIDDTLGGITGVTYSVVSSLPATGAQGTIYLVSNSGSGNNIYDEYIYVSNKFEKIGTTETDLTGYLTSSDVIPITNQEIDSITNSAS